MDYIRRQMPHLQEWLRQEAVNRAAEAARRKSLPRFDYTAAAVFNERAPLSVLHRVALSGALPKHLSDELKVVTWVRAVLLNRFDIARELGPALAAQHPQLRPEMRRFLDQPSEETAAFVLLWLPGARPYVSRGYGRNVPVDQHDEWGRNWWYHFTEPEMHGIDLPYMGDWSAALPAAMPLLPHLPFTSPNEEAEAAQESAMLQKTGERGLNWISLCIVKAVQREPNRRDAAELLFRVLDAARLGQWGVLPDYQLPYPGLKAAHRLLSTRYRASKWFRQWEDGPSLVLPGIK